MPGDPRLRVSDADRERTAELLREHHAVGRLTREEFEDRMERAFAARTRGDLDELLADLPAIDLYRLPSAGIQRARRDVRRRGWPGGGIDHPPGAAWMVVGWSAWVAVGSVSLLVWLGLAVSYGGAAWLPWFLLVVIPWLAALTRHRPLPGILRPARVSGAGIVRAAATLCWFAFAGWVQ
jgi:hypothetical protein